MIATCARVWRLSPPDVDAFHGEEWCPGWAFDVAGDPGWSPKGVGGPVWLLPPVAADVRSGACIPVRLVLLCRNGFPGVGGR